MKVKLYFLVYYIKVVIIYTSAITLFEAKVIEFMVMFFFEVARLDARFGPPILGKLQCYSTNMHQFVTWTCLNFSTLT